jgi:quercetin dioxygenase-like cupin family protein
MSSSLLYTWAEMRRLPSRSEVTIPSPASALTRAGARYSRCVGYVAMRYANDKAGFETGGFSQRLLHGPVAERANESADELLYVLSGGGMARIDDEAHELAPGTAAYVARGVPWSAAGDMTLLSVLVHEPAGSGDSVVVDLTAAEKSSATAGRQFVLGPGCPSATQFVGLVPPGRAPDHFHPYDEVIYILEGEGVLEIEGRTAPLAAGSCIHLPARLVHCVANTGTAEMRLLGVFRPAGSPAETYYPDGTPAAVPERS